MYELWLVTNKVMMVDNWEDIEWKGVRLHVNHVQKSLVGGGTNRHIIQALDTKFQGVKMLLVCRQSVCQEVSL